MNRSVVQKVTTVAYLLLLAGCSGAGGQWAPPATNASVAIASSATIAGVFKHLFSFDGTNGKAPFATLIGMNGAPWGTTYGGGTTNGGTVFKITTVGKQSVIHSFKGGRDGALPEASLLAVGATLYGTSINGGGPGDEGIVFAIAASGTESVLHRFRAGNDGANPYAGLTRFNGLFYGTTAAGGAHSGGTVFSISASGKESVIYSFGSSGSDGTTPIARLHNVNGTLYGTTSYGGGKCGSYGCGTVFKINASGAEKVLYAFKGGKDGSVPAAPVIDVHGSLYGTTSAGGAQNAGTVFLIAPSGRERVLYSFKGGTDGAVPQELTIVNGTLYGTTAAGGSKNDGAIFALTTSGKETVLYSFKGGADGAVPRAGLHAFAGALYGTTAEGGSKKNGTVFSISL